jgi:hypothetical protein
MTRRFRGELFRISQEITVNIGETTPKANGTACEILDFCHFPVAFAVSIRGLENAGNNEIRSHDQGSP